MFFPTFSHFAFYWGMQPYEWEEEEELDLESQERLLHGYSLETMGFQAVLEEGKKQEWEMWANPNFVYVFFP